MAFLGQHWDLHQSWDTVPHRLLTAPGCSRGMGLTQSRSRLAQVKGPHASWTLVYGWLGGLDPISWGQQEIPAGGPKNRGGVGRGALELKDQVHVVVPLPTGCGKVKSIPP